LLIAPSTSEGDGLVIIEGMKKGVPLLLSDIPDFRRFGLPDKNYCENANEFVSQINQFGANLDSLRVPEKITEQILSSRSIAVVGDTWVSFLKSL
jgi:glycosyltransferase involved in cell wall biosynthesis